MPRASSNKAPKIVPRSAFKPRSIDLGRAETEELYGVFNRPKIYYILTKNGEFLNGPEGRVVCHSWAQACEQCDQRGEDFIMSIWDRHVLYAVRTARAFRRTNWARAVVFPHEWARNDSNLESHQERLGL